ncbi:MAG: DMT family transporter [Pseudomonadota bacterium]
MNATNATSTPKRAIVFTIGAIFLFGLMDATAKSIGQQTNTLLAIWARYTGQMLLVALIVAPRIKQVATSQYPKLQVARSILLMLATLFFFLSFRTIGLAEATAVMSLNPLLITLGGAIFLSEALGPRRIIGILIAFVGALIIIRPGTDVFQPAALLPLVAATCFATYALITRRVGPDEDVWTSLFYTGLVGAIVSTCTLPFIWPDELAPHVYAQMALLAVFGTTGQLLLIRALSMAEAGMLAPFNYTGLVFAVFWGFVLFDEWPDALTLLGTVVIAGAGLYVWQRETQLKTAKRTT